MTKTMLDKMKTRITKKIKSGRKIYLGFSKGEELSRRNIAIGALEILVSRR